MELNYFIERMMKQQSIALSYDKEVVKTLADTSYDPLQGARLIRRKLQELIEDPLAEKIISGEVAEMSEIKISLVGGEIQIKQVELARA